MPEIFHYVPLKTGYELDEPFMSICGEDVTCGWFYTSLLAFTCMPVRRCAACENAVVVGAGLAVLVTAAIVR